MTPSKSVTKAARRISFATGSSHGESIRRLERLQATADHYAAVEDGPYVLTHEQERAVEAVLGGFEGSTRGRLIRPWQSGKTVIAAEVAKRQGALKTLVVVDRPVRIEETARVWSRHLPGADVVVADDASDRANLEESIRLFTESDAHAILFTTYRLLDRVIQMYASVTDARLGLACFEDAHVIAGFPALRRSRTCNIPAGARLFASARAATAIGSGDVGLCSMDGGEFGDVFYRLTYADAVKQGLVCPYATSAIHYEETELIATLANLSTHRAEIADGKARELAALAIAVVKSVRKMNLHRVVSFHFRIEESRAFAEAIELAFDHLPADVCPRDLEVQSLDFHASQEQRRQKLGWLKGGGTGVRVLTNPHLVAHSEACASADAIVFADPKSAGAGGVDALSRSLRPSRGKLQTQVLLPVRRNPGESDREALKRHENSSSAGIYALLNGMDPDGIGHSQSLAPKRRSSKGPRSKATPSIRINFNASDIEVIESQVDVADLRAPKADAVGTGSSEIAPAKSESIASTADLKARPGDEASGNHRGARQAKVSARAPGLEEWERGEISETQKAQLMRIHSWPNVDRRFTRVRRELMAADHMPPSERMLARIVAEENPGTTSSYMLKPQRLNTKHLASIVESVASESDPDSFEDAVRARIDTGTAVLRRCKFSDHPEIAVDAFIGVLNGSERPVDLKHARRPRKFQGDADCRAAGRYFGSALLAGGEIARDGAIKLPNPLPANNDRPPRKDRDRTRRARRGPDGASTRPE